MPEVNAHQFWKANPNQMALPGMEELSHPGAVHLAQGYSFKAHKYPIGVFEITAHHQDWSEDQPVAELNWHSKRGAPGSYKQGEIGWVHTNPEHQKTGLATAMYGIGRQMAPVKPQHSTDRTHDGDAFAAKSTAKYGGRVPKNIHEWTSQLDPKVDRLLGR